MKGHCRSIHGTACNRNPLRHHTQNSIGLHLAALSLRCFFGDRPILGTALILYNLRKKLGQVATVDIFNSKLIPLLNDTVVDDLSLRLLGFFCKPIH